MKYKGQNIHKTTFTKVSKIYKCLHTQYVEILKSIVEKVNCFQHLTHVQTSNNFAWVFYQDLVSA